MDKQADSANNPASPAPAGGNAAPQAGSGIANPAASGDIRNEMARFILEQLKGGQLAREQALRFLNELKPPKPAAAAPAAEPAARPVVDDIAIIGMACRFPQADTKEDFWHNLLAGRNSIRPFPLSRQLDLAAIDTEGTKLFQGGFLENVDGFDNEYFRIPPVMAKAIDPYQRLLMEVLVETIEDAGYHRGNVYGKNIGVFAGNDHTHRLFNNYLNFIDQPDFNAITGSWTAVLASRLSYLFNLKGPAVVLDTACSSGLVALDYAIKALRNGDCESALIGAANLFFAPGKGIVGEIENEDFLVRAFDKRASGTVWGEGVAAIMIKPLSAALRDGDPIHAVVKAIAVNNDGASNGLTAPNAKAQQEILLKTWERAQINPESISYIETHGTGTHLGDPIEIKGLIGAFERNSRRKQFCGIGSVKTNIGHTVGVAGLASLIKVVLSLKHQQLPPSINFSEPNPFIDFCNSPVFLNDRILPWPKGGQIRTAGISSFSLSGTNCHVLVQEASGAGASGVATSGVATPASGTAPGATATVEPAPVARLFPLSARNPALLLETVRRLVAHFSGVGAIHSASQWQQACYTASVAREHHPLRAVMLISEPARLLPQLERLLAVLEQDAAADQASGQATPQSATSSAPHASGHSAPALREWQDGDDYLLLQTVPGPESEHGDRQTREAAIDGARSGTPASLLALARLYVKGAPVKWELLYRDQTIARLHLPAQPFEHKRFWDKAPGTLAPKNGTASNGTASNGTASTGTASTAFNQGNSASHAASLPTSQGEGVPAAGAGANAAPPELNRAAVLARVQGEASRVAGLEEGLAPLPYQVAAYIWTEVLGYQQVNLREDFYALGGDSLSALKIVQLFNLLFGLNLQVTDLLGAPNLHEFVQKLEQQYGFGALLLASADAESAGDAQGQAISGTNSAIAPGHEPIVPLPEAGAWPLSRAQKRMFLLERLSPGSTVYNVNGVVPLPGLPDLAATGRVIDHIIARHEVLRTAFGMEGEQLQQQVWPAAGLAPFMPELIRLEANGDAALQAALARFIRPFDIARPPLLRLGFFVAPDQSCHMAIDMHHIVTDGSSMGVLVGEFMALHAGHSLPPLPFQYKDFAVWQNACFDGAAINAEGAKDAAGGDIGSRAEAGPAAGKFNPMQAHRDFWLAEFADPAPALELQTDYPRPAYQDFKGAKQHWLIDAAQTAQLQQLARQQGTTLFILMLASLNALLYRLGGGDDLVLGTPVAGRSRHDLHGLIGMFVNTLALRNRVKEEDSFSDLLARVKQHTLAALNHQDYPYEELVEALQLPRNGGRNPLFDLYFVFQNEDMGLGGGQGLSMLAFDNGTAKFDMTIVARQDAAGIHIDWEYATALYHADSIARMGRAWQKLLADICHAPHQRVDALDLLTQGERTQLLQGFNQTASAFPRDKTLAQLFEAQATINGAAIALEMDGQELSYAELNRRANRLAHHLRAQGVEPGQCVGLLYQRSFGMIEAILAVLKLGAIYVPLDAEHPPERCLAMLEECDARCLLAGPDMALDGLAIPLIHPHLLKLEHADSGNPHTDRASVNGDSLAYIIFTSGSTGRPKGTLIRHKSAARVVLNTNYLTLSASDRILQLSNYAFDGSVFDIWAALLHGGRLVLVHKRELIDMDALSRLISERQISVFFITTALFNALVDTRIECLQRVRHILFGGELASIKHVQRVAALLGPGRLIHVYGPTETTVFATAHPLDAAKLTHGNVPIGAPLANTTAYVLDNKLQPVPIGVAGELYIGGDGVSLGYLGRPDLTNERFLPNPFEAGQTLYHSGDVVKWQLDGDQPAIVFLGRRDHQVKIRGFRIELGEIEAALGRHAAVKESLVGADPDANGNKQLCAWVVPQVWDEASAPALAQELRSFLASSLPDYMVPSALVCLQAFELNRNGKIDRAKLPAALPQQQELVAARDELEALLVQVWAELLGLPAVGIHDNFFALGGDSIKGIQIVARLQAHGFAAQIPLLFQHQTIAELAPHVQRAAASTAEQGAVTGEVGLNPIQHWMLDEDGLWHGYGLADLPRDPRHHFNQAMLIARSNLASAEQLAQALAALCEQHDALRSVFRRGASDTGIDANANASANTNANASTEPHTAGGWQASIRAPGCQPWQIREFDLPPLATNPTGLQPNEYGSGVATSGVVTSGVATSGVASLATVAADPAMQAALLQCQSVLDIEAGTLISAGLFRAAPASGQMSYLCLTIHHLVVDVVSWNILLEDLQTCLRRIGEGQPLQLPAKTASVAAWQSALQDYAGDAHGARASLPYWLALTPHAADTLPGQHASTRPGTLAQGRIDSVLLPASVSQQLLGEANRSYTTEPQHLLLTALGNALGQWCSSDTTLVLLESHGREGVEVLPDIGRTVGWFTTTYPFALQRGKDAAHAIKHTKEALRNVPGKGRDFGALRYLAIDPAQRARLARLVPAVSFNFLGSGQGASHVCPLGRQLVNSPHTPLPQALDLIASFKGEQLELEALYDNTRLDAAAVRDFLGLFKQELTSLVTHCCGVQGEEKTASDFTVTKIDQSELDDIFSDLDLL